MKSSQGKKMSTTSTSGDSSRSSSSVGMMGAPATPSQTAQATVETSALVSESSPTEGRNGRSCLRLATFLEWLAVAEVEGHCAFSGGGGPLGDKVVVTTLHQSKGLEWDDVYVCRVLTPRLFSSSSFSSLRNIMFLVSCNSGFMLSLLIT